MGQGLYYGIVTGLLISPQHHSPEEIQNEIEKAFPNMFEAAESEDETLIYLLKSEFLGNHFQDFLREQFALMGVLEDQRSQEYITQMDGMTGTEIMENIKSRDISEVLLFYSITGRRGSSDLLPQWKNCPTIQLEVLGYASLYKAYIECGYRQLSLMLGRLIQQTSENPLGKLFFMDVN